MTFENTAWAIDGALLNSSLARRAEYAAIGGVQGVVKPGDLRVHELAVPGQGVIIEPGVGLVTNDYQTDPNETYVVSNPSTHTIPASDMPAASAAARSFILAIVVGDPDFSQTGHPWMAATDPPAGEEQSFQYVRPTLIEVSAGAIALDVSYPALVLARIDIPADTTTITDAMIVDLRSLGRPRQHQEAFVSPGAAWTNAAPKYIPLTDFADWGRAEFNVSVKVPTWARRAIVITSINGIRFSDNSVNITGEVRTQLGTVSGAAASFDYEVAAGGGVQRENLQTASEYDVSAVAGQTVNVRVQGRQTTPAAPTDNQRLRLQAGSQQIYDIRFFEE